MKPPRAGRPEPGGSTEAELDALRRQNAELSEAVAARDSFIAVAAHELRNPMTPIIGQVDYLLNSVQSGKAQPYQVEERLLRIQRAMAQYVRRATSLLDVSRINSGKFRLTPAPFDLTDLLRGVVGTYAEAARYAGSPIGITAPESLPGCWDRLAMEQIIDNLVSNAIKYGARRPVEVCAEASGNTVTLRVRDHGPGISTEDRARIFGRFERAVGTSERHSGFGVGLWVVGQLVAVMQGTVTVGDADGGGSVFNVTLPRDAKPVRP